MNEINIFSCKTNKRGRPVVNVEVEKYKLIYPKLSDRHLLNKYYANTFINNVIVNNEIEEKYEYLNFLFFPRYKNTILTEIGKLQLQYSLAKALKVAKYICENKLNTNKSISYIKNYRKLGKNKINGTVCKLLKVLDNALLTEKEIKKVLICFVNKTIDKVTV